MRNSETGFFSTETAYQSNREINLRIDKNFDGFPIDIQNVLIKKVIEKIDNSPRIY